MTDKTNTHALPVWTEVEYTALCKNPYLLTPFFIQQEGQYKGAPLRTKAGGRWLNGYSDHLPVVMYLVKEKK